MPIVRTVVVDCHIEDVFAYVADPANDRAWCDVARTSIAGEPPARIAWREDGIGVSLALEAVWTSTRVTHYEDARPGWSRRRAVARRLRALRQALERR